MNQSGILNCRYDSYNKSYSLLIILMPERRQWTEEEDQQIKRLQSTNCLRTKKGQKLKWDEIAEHLRKNIKNSHRSGKQCRQRWHNQLDPNVIQDKQWMEEQIQILLDKQRIYGNRWAEVAKSLKGRTDNNVKNFFYSTLRRGVRRINAYISSIRKKSHPIKQINPSVLSKILTVADERHTEKVKIKKQNEVITELAKNIRDLLINISLQQKQQNDKIMNNQQKKERIIHDIVEFNKNCKRKKSKKKSEEQQQIQQEQDQINLKIQEKPKITMQRPFSLFKTFQSEQKDATNVCLKNSKSFNEEVRQTRSRKNKKIIKTEKSFQSKKQQILEENNLCNLNLKEHKKITSNYEIKGNQKNIGQSISFSKMILDNSVKSNQNYGTKQFFQNIEIVKKKQTQQQGQKDIFGIYQQQFNGLFKSIEFPTESKKELFNRDVSVDFMKMSSGLDAPLINLRSSISFNNNQGRASESFNGINNDLKRKKNEKNQ